jgi:hypothetical protein
VAGIRGGGRTAAVTSGELREVQRRAEKLPNADDQQKSDMPDCAAAGVTVASPQTPRESARQFTGKQTATNGIGGQIEIGGTAGGRAAG